jgi:hypothetical protein
MPEIPRFLGIIIRMLDDEHNPPHLHAEYSGRKVLVDFNGDGRWPCRRAAAGEPRR